MTAEIHFNVNESHDFFIVTGENIDELKDRARKECLKRNLTEYKNNLYSIIK